MIARVKIIVLLWFCIAVPVIGQEEKQTVYKLNQAREVLPDLTHALPSERFFGREVTPSGHVYHFATSRKMGELKALMLKFLADDWRVLFEDDYIKRMSDNEVEDKKLIVTFPILSDKNKDVTVVMSLYNEKKFGESSILKVRVISKSRIKRLESLPKFDQIFADQKKLPQEDKAGMKIYVYLTEMKADDVRSKFEETVKQGWYFKKPFAYELEKTKKELEKEGTKIVDRFLLLHKDFKEFSIAVSLTQNDKLKGQSHLVLVVRDNWGHEYDPIFEHRSQAKKHVKAILSKNLGDLYTTYDKTVRLMPGHEFLKAEYGLSNQGRNVASIVKRADLLNTMGDKINDRPKRGKNAVAQEAERRMKQLRFELLEIKEGDFVVAPSDKVGTPDGMLHFDVKKGDAIYKVTPPVGDFLLLQLRDTNKGYWRVVAEYWD